MEHMKKLKKIFMIAIFVPIIMITSSFYKNMEVKIYIKENNSFDLIDVNKYDVFLSGENHTMEKSDKFKKEFFTYLNKKAKKGEKFFGQFGSEHIYQDYMDSDLLTMDEVRFGTLLNGKSSPVKNKVYSLLCVYENKEGKFPPNNFFDYSLFKGVKEDGFVELSGEGSPFYKKEYLFGGSKEGSVTCDYIQGLMILKNCRKTHDYDK